MKKIQRNFLLALLCCATCTLESMKKDIDDLPVASHDGKQLGLHGQITQIIESVKKLSTLPEKRQALIELAKAVHKDKDKLDDPRLIQCLQSYNLLTAKGEIPDCVRSIIRDECRFEQGTLYVFKKPVHEKILAHAGENRLAHAGENREHKPSVPDKRHPKVVPEATSFTIYGPDAQPDNKELERFFRQTEGRYRIIFTDVDNQLRGMYTRDASENKSAIYAWAVKKLDNGQLDHQEIRS